MESKRLEMKQHTVQEAIPMRKLRFEQIQEPQQILKYNTTDQNISI